MSAISFSADSDPSAVALCEEIRTRRDAGVVHVEYRRVASTADATQVSPHDVVTAFVESLGMTPSLPWDELDVDRALVVATRVIHQDLAYCSDLMPIEDAEALARRFVESCGGGDATFVTNGSLGLQRNGTRVAILWVEDED